MQQCQQLCEIYQFTVFNINNLHNLIEQEVVYPKFLFIVYLTSEYTYVLTIHKVVLKYVLFISNIILPTKNVISKR